MLVIAIFKHKHRCGVISGVGVAQFYDRIAHSLSILLYQKEGAPLSSCLIMFGVIQCMTCFFLTIFGDSKRILRWASRNTVSRHMTGQWGCSINFSYGFGSFGIINERGRSCVQCAISNVSSSTHSCRFFIR